MPEFIEAIINHQFMQHALIAGILASFACGITGTFVVIKRMSFISGGIAHTALGGVGIALFLGVDPVLGALAAAVLSAIILGMVTIKMKEHSDTAIGALWAIGMAVGVIFISKTPGYHVNLMTYLFGNILMVSADDLLILLFLDISIILLVVFFFRMFVAISFDELYSSLNGVRVNAVYILLLCIIALTIVVLIRIVGLILVIALLTLPAAISLNFVKRVSSMIFLSVFLGLVFTVSGLAVSYQPDLPAGATIIIIAGIFYLFSLLLKKFLNKT